MGTYGGYDIRTGRVGMMGFIRRKAEEAASAFYRCWLWPWARAYKELTTKSIMKQHSYIPGTGLGGRNFIGRDAVLRDCTVGFGSYVQSRCDMKDTDIGRYTSIGRNVETVIGSHPTRTNVAMHPAFNTPVTDIGFTYAEKQTYDDRREGRTHIGSDVWIGNDVRIMGGVSIGDGAVVGAGALVTGDLAPYSVNVGVPARTVRYRFTDEQIRSLLETKWWDKDEHWIRENIDRFADIEEFVK